MLINGGEWNGGDFAFSVGTGAISGVLIGGIVGGPSGAATGGVLGALEGGMTYAFSQFREAQMNRWNKSGKDMISAFWIYGDMP